MTEPHDGEIPDGLSCEREWACGRRSATAATTTCAPATRSATTRTATARLGTGPQRPRPGRSRCCCCTGRPPRPGRVAALKLRGRAITGTARPVRRHRRAVRRAARLPLRAARCCCRSATSPRCGWSDCAIPRLEAARLHTEGDLHLPRCPVERGIRLTDAHIGTDLLLNQSTCGADRRGRAIAADGMTVAQDLQAELMETDGEVSLRGATVGGSLSLRGSRLRNPYGRLRAATRRS